MAHKSEINNKRQSYPVSAILDAIQQEVDLRWKRLKALSEHPEL